MIDARRPPVERCASKSYHRQFMLRSYLKSSSMKFPAFFLELERPQNLCHTHRQSDIFKGCQIEIETTQNMLISLKT